MESQGEENVLIASWGDEIVIAMYVVWIRPKLHIYVCYSSLTSEQVVTHAVREDSPMSLRHTMASKTQSAHDSRLAGCS